MATMWLTLLAQTMEETRTSRGALSALLGVLLVVIVGTAVWLVRCRVREAGDREGFMDLCESLGFEPVHGQEALQRISERIGELFGEQAIYARQLRLAGVLRSVEQDGLTIDAAQVRLGLDASNANINTLSKLVLLIHLPGPPLPEFSLLPNHFLFATVQKDTVFHHTGTFGRRNLVLGEDKWHIAHILGQDVRDALADNRELVIESRGDLLAFYLHDERVQPADLAAFINRCTHLTRLMAGNAETYTPSPRAGRTTRHPLLNV